MKINNMMKETDLIQQQKGSKFAKEETSLFLSMVDSNILQNIFIQLVQGYQYSVCDKELSNYDEKEIKKAFTLLLNFCLSCKLFFEISKQPLFPLILNNININLNYQKCLKILLIKQKVEKDRRDKEKDINSIFYQSCAYGKFDIINTLINCGANINHPKPGLQFTPLLEATFQGNIKTVKKLIKFNNLNINQQDKNGGCTALFYACQYEQQDIVKLLLSRKDIDINIKYIEGKTALDVAKERNNENIIKMLQNYQNLNL